MSVDANIFFMEKSVSFVRFHTHVRPAVEQKFAIPFV